MLEKIRVPYFLAKKERNDEVLTSELMNQKRKEDDFIKYHLSASISHRLGSNATWSSHLIELLEYEFLCIFLYAFCISLYMYGIFVCNIPLYSLYILLIRPHEYTHNIHNKNNYSFDEVMKTKLLETVMDGRQLLFPIVIKNRN